jgi:hypothetical protein
MQTVKTTRKRTGKYRKHLRKLLKKGATTCWLCGKPCAADVEADHVIPHSRGGSGHRVNIRAAHGSCNRARNRIGAAATQINNVPSLEGLLNGTVIAIVAAETVPLDPRMWTAWWHHPEHLLQQAARKNKIAASTAVTPLNSFDSGGRTLEDFHLEKGASTLSVEVCAAQRLGVDGDCNSGMESSDG